MPSRSAPTTVAAPARGRTILTAVAVVGAVIAAIALSTVSATATVAPAATTGDGGVTDTNLAYVGRWDTTAATAYVPTWAGSYIQTGFTGTTVKLRQRSAVNVYASIDGAPYRFFNTGGTVNLTPTPLAAGSHKLKITYRSGDVVFQGLILDAGAHTLADSPSSQLVEFVGDSITAGYLTSELAVTSYSFLLGERLGVRHTTIARAGYCLVAQTGCVGQRTQFFKLTSDGTTNWDFTRYQASAVVINLGTNDAGHGVSNADFQAAYLELMTNIRARYPNAAIIALETLRMRYVAQTKAAVAARNSAGDSRVYYVSTEGWLTHLVDYTDAGDGHPNDQGHAKMAARLAPIIAPLIGVPTP